jgi:Family of unknown function (DUF6221)
VTGVDERVAWLTATLDEVERVAKAATPGRWQAGGTYGDWLSVLPRDHVLAPDYRPPGFSQGQHVADARVAGGGMTAWAADLSGSGFPEGNARHIALHDPRSVLARVEADRRILVRHARFPGGRDLNGKPACPTCATTFGLVLWPCPTFEAVLSAYRYMPGFRAEWTTSDQKPAGH